MKFDIKEVQAQATGVAKKVLTHHAIMSFVLIIGILIYTIYTVNNLITQDSDQVYRSEKEAEITQANFDDDTIDKIDELRNSSNAGPPSLPGGRINPFVE